MNDDHLLIWINEALYANVSLSLLSVCISVYLLHPSHLFLYPPLSFLNIPLVLSLILLSLSLHSVCLFPLPMYALLSYVSSLRIGFFCHSPPVSMSLSPSLSVCLPRFLSVCIPMFHVTAFHGLLTQLKCRMFNMYYRTPFAIGTAQPHQPTYSQPNVLLE